MRTIAIEEHFLASGFSEAMMRSASSQRLGLERGLHGRTTTETC